MVLIRLIHIKVHNLWRECMFVLYRYHFEQIYNIDWTVYSCFLLNPMILPPPPHVVCPASQIVQSWGSSDWVHTETNQIQIRFRTDFNYNQIRTRSYWFKTNNPASTNITSQLFAVCLAACKNQHRKWCHPGDAINPVWTPASWWGRLETDLKGSSTLQFALFVCLIIGLSCL